jgi:hypothetical protein
MWLVLHAWLMWLNMICLVMLEKDNEVLKCVVVSDDIVTVSSDRRV